MISVHFQGKPFNITVIQVYAPTMLLCQRSWSQTVLWEPTRPSRTSTKKRCPFHHRGLESKSRKSRVTWSNRQVWPWSTKWSRAKDNSFAKRMPSSNNTRDDSTHGHHQMVSTKIRLIISCHSKMEKLYTVSQNKTRIWLWLRSWTPYCKIQTLIEENREKPLDHSGMT